MCVPNAHMYNYIDRTVKMTDIACANLARLTPLQILYVFHIIVNCEHNHESNNFSNGHTICALPLQNTKRHTAVNLVAIATFFFILATLLCIWTYGAVLHSIL